MLYRVPVGNSLREGRVTVDPVCQPDNSDGGQQNPKSEADTWQSSLSMEFGGFLLVLLDVRRFR
jgi:hypothetical protein